MKFSSYSANTPNKLNLVISYMLVPTIILLSACSSGRSDEDSQTSPPPITEESYQAKLDTLVGNSRIPGAISRLSQGNQTWIAASGVSDKENHINITTTTQMRIASMTKPLVAVTILKLVEEGFFKLEDKIAPLLPSPINTTLPNADIISLRQILSMTSGIKDYTDDDDFNIAVDNDSQKKWSATEVLSFILNKNAEFEPGTSWDYSNSNYVLFDIIVLNATGVSLANQMRRIILEPLGMDSTYMEVQETSGANGQVLSARGYDGNKDITDTNDGIGFGDGGVISTVADLSMFLTGIFRDNKILNTLSLTEMLNFHATEDYGLGIEQRRYDIGLAIAHSGGSSGFSGDMMYFPEEDVTWVFLTNQLEDNDSDFGAFASLSSVLSN